MTLGVRRRAGIRFSEGVLWKILHARLRVNCLDRGGWCEWLSEIIVTRSAKTIYKLLLVLSRAKMAFFGKYRYLWCKKRPFRAQCKQLKMSYLQKPCSRKVQKRGTFWCFEKLESLIIKPLHRIHFGKRRQREHLVLLVIGHWALACQLDWSLGIGYWGLVIWHLTPRPNA